VICVRTFALKSGVIAPNEEAAGAFRQPPSARRQASLTTPLGTERARNGHGMGTEKKKKKRGGGTRKRTFSKLSRLVQE